MQVDAATLWRLMNEVVSNFMFVNFFDDLANKCMVLSLSLTNILEEHASMLGREITIKSIFLFQYDHLKPR